MSVPLLLLKNVERLGEAYRDQYLKDQALGQLWKQDKLDNDWWEALKFFFSHSFMRGRRDKLSSEYYSFTIDRLKTDFLKTDKPEDEFHALQQQLRGVNSRAVSEFKKEHKLGKRNAVTENGFEEVANRYPIIGLLTSRKKVDVTWEGQLPYSKEVRLGNDEDVMMVLDTLNFICEEGQQNIYIYIKKEIQGKKIKEVYDKLDDLHGIGDKIAALVIRDVGLMNDGLIAQDYEYAFPVDTWVETVAKMIGCEDQSSKGIKRYFIQQCGNAINPLPLAAGLWHLGSHSLKILFHIITLNGSETFLASSLDKDSQEYLDKLTSEKAATIAAEKKADSEAKNKRRYEEQ